MKDLNSGVTHPLQSYEWGEFRKKTGIKVIRGKNFQLTIHKIPHTKFAIGYLPKGTIPTEELLSELKKIGQENNCIFIQLEPNVTSYKRKEISNKLVKSAHPLFTKYTLVLGLTKSEEELLKQMHPKTRYNIRVAEKHGVKIVEDNSDRAFEQYWKLTQETTSRQKFYSHTKKYHELMFETLKRPVILSKAKNPKGVKDEKNKLTAHLFLAKYKEQILTAWILFVFKDTLYYPYGASSREHKEVMAQNLMMWEGVKFGKKLGLKKFDMWGSLGPNPNPKDPWYGFHKFKLGYGPRLVEFVGSYDLVINPIFYQVYKLADKARWLLLRRK